MSLDERTSVERFGQGPDLVLLHGWGMNGAVWHGIAQELAAHYRLHLVDLPGFGNSPLQAGTDYTLPLAGRAGGGHIA